MRHTLAQIVAIIIQDLRVFLTDRSNLPTLLVTPAVMTVVIAMVSGGAVSGGTPVCRLDVLDQDQTPASADLLQRIQSAQPALTLCPQADDEGDRCELGPGGLSMDSALDRVANSTSIALLVIPEGYGAALEAMQSTTLIFRTADAFGPAQAARQAIEAALAEINAGAASAGIGLSVAGQLLQPALAPDEAAVLSKAINRTALDLWSQHRVTVVVELSGENTQGGLMDGIRRGLGQSVPGMGVMFVMMTVMGGMAGLIEEKEQGTLQRLASMPLSRASLLAGKILARFSLGLLQFSVVLVVGLLLGLDLGKDPLALVLMIMAYTLSITALSFAVGSRLKNAAQASGLALLLTLTLAPLGGAWWPISITPRAMQIIGHVSPVAWAMDGFTRLTYESGTLASVWMELAILAAFSLAAFALAIPRFRYSLD